MAGTPGAVVVGLAGPPPGRSAGPAARAPGRRARRRFRARPWRLPCGPVSRRWVRRRRPSVRRACWPFLRGAVSRSPGAGRAGRRERPAAAREPACVCPWCSARPPGSCGAVVAAVAAGAGTPPGEASACGAADGGGNLDAASSDFFCLRRCRPGGLALLRRLRRLRGLRLLVGLRRWGRAAARCPSLSGSSPGAGAGR